MESMVPENASLPGENERTSAAAGVMEKRILFFTCVAHSLTHIYMVIYSVVLVKMSLAFGVSKEEIARYATISIVLFGAGSLPATWLGEKWGEKPLLVAFFVLSALGGAILGLAQTPAHLAAGMTVLGLGTSIFHPVGNTFIAKGIQNPGRAMGINGLWGSIGEALGPLIAGAAAALSWRAAYLVLTAPTLALGAWLAATRIDVPHDPAPIQNGASGGKSPVLLAFLFLAMMCGGFQFWIVKTWLPTHVQGELPDVLRGGYLTAVIYLIGGFGQLLAGRMVHDQEGRGLYLAVFLVSAPLIYWVGNLEGVTLLAMASLMSFLMFAAQPIENVLLSRSFSPRWRSSAFGLKFTLAFGIGGLGASWSGWAESRYGTGATFTMAAAFTGLAALMALGAYQAGRESGSEAPVETASVSDP
jgi:MFS family permease